MRQPDGAGRRCDPNQRIEEGDLYREDDIAPQQSLDQAQKQEGEHERRGDVDHTSEDWCKPIATHAASTEERLKLLQLPADAVLDPLAQGPDSDIGDARRGGCR